jgi:hypothetical protein
LSGEVENWQDLKEESLNPVKPESAEAKAAYSLKNCDNYLEKHRAGTPTSGIKVRNMRNAAMVSLIGAR